MLMHCQLCVSLQQLQLEALSNQEKVKLPSITEALGLEVTKVPSKSTHHLDELERARGLDKQSAKLGDVDGIISTTIATKPQIQTLLSDTAYVWYVTDYYYHC